MAIEKKTNTYSAKVGKSVNIQYKKRLSKQKKKQIKIEYHLL